MTTIQDLSSATCFFQGGGLAISGSIVIGSEPIIFPTVKSPLIGLNYAKETVPDETPIVVLRPGQYFVSPEDPCAMMFSYRFEQTKELVDKKIVFRLVSDPEGLSVGSSFGAMVDSNYREYSMNLPKTEISKANFGILKERFLPEDYIANILVKYWRGTTTHLDAWFMFEIGYVEKDVDLSAADPTEIRLNILARAKLFTNISDELIRRSEI